MSALVSLLNVCLATPLLLRKGEGQWSKQQLGFQRRAFYARCRIQGRQGPGTRCPSAQRPAAPIAGFKARCRDFFNLPHPSVKTFCKKKFTKEQDQMNALIHTNMRGAGTPPRCRQCCGHAVFGGQHYGLVSPTRAVLTWKTHRTLVSFGVLIHSSKQPDVQF